ncbi:hypothetical protein Tam10B_1249 [Bifidobacterium vansinderenii]|uniref:Uncharacterized protein n=1 Tax=Bifidobacterium vansinderenii TaxID=1984871 RepID=A0A229VXM3_9BIFI|nr:hypothetical protein Tam10B_1249 [Bifidobacterium vansinderenii]
MDETPQHAAEPTSNHVLWARAVGISEAGNGISLNNAGQVMFAAPRSKRSSNPSA